MREAFAPKIGESDSMTATTSTQTAGHAAGLWWADALRSPKLDNGVDHAAMASIIALTQLSGPPQEKADLDKFARILGERIDAKLEGPEAFIVGVDYRPDEILRICANLAGLQDSITRWPWKTVMWVKPNEVVVRHGYAADDLIIWSK